MKNGLFITGTDTGVGKTIVAATLAYALNQRQIDFGYIKPMESGIECEDYLTQKSDAALVKKAGNLPESLDAIVPFTFKEPLAPLLAARREKIRISKNDLISAVKERINLNHFTIVEGAGGLLAPLCEKFLILDLIKELDFPVLVVCRTGLGSINHTMLTLDRLRREKLHPIGIIANHNSATPGIAESEFLSQLAEFDQISVLGELPYITNFKTTGSYWNKLASNINVDEILNKAVNQNA